MSPAASIWTRAGEDLVPPDLFNAAMNNDLSELQAALDEGQDINQIDRAGMTPAHVACIYNSTEFVVAACKIEAFDPWIRDLNDRTPFEHAWARNNKVAMREIYFRQHPDSPSVARIRAGIPSRFEEERRLVAEWVKNNPEEALKCVPGMREKEETGWERFRREGRVSIFAEERRMIADAVIRRRREP